MRIVITGSTGYIGARLAKNARRRGHDVIEASRQPPAQVGSSWLHFDLFSDELIQLPTGTDLVVHLAFHASAQTHSTAEKELSSARRLIDSAKKLNARGIFISSQTARADAPTLYGQTKWRIEQEVLAAGWWVVRPGQVYGGELRGLFGKLVGIVKKLPVLPAFLPAPKIQPIHVDDLIEGILRIAERFELPRGIYRLASPTPIKFSVFLDEIAEARLRRIRLFVPVPIFILTLIGALIGSNKRDQLGLVRLGSLFGLRKMSSAEDLQKLSLTTRQLSSGLHPSGNDRRRRLLKEGKAFLTYILKTKPDASMLIRYARAIEKLRNGVVLGIPRIMLRNPTLLSLLRKSSWPDDVTADEFAFRVDAATLIAEVTPQGGQHFLRASSRFGLLRSTMSIGSALASEAFWLIPRIICAPILRLYLTSPK